MRVVVGLSIALAVVSVAVVHASPPVDLGAAFRAYDANDLPAAKLLLDTLDDKAVVSHDYVLWLRGMVALRRGDASAAKAAFETLGKLGGSRFSREVPWRLADVAWLRGDRTTAAGSYAKLIVADAAGETGDVGTA